jgi:predicted phosphodiesterase
MLTPDYVIELPENTQGQDFFVGDLHGRYDPLMAQLGQVGFDFRCDRLICVGDLVDRGEQSEQVVGLLDQAWFFSVRGNHDQFILDQYEPERIMLNGDYANYSAREIHKIMAAFESDWFYALDASQQDAIAHKLMPLPYVLVVPIAGYRIGVCHAAVPSAYREWADFMADLPQRNTRELTIRLRKVAQNLAKGKDRVLSGIDYTLHGHCTFAEPLFGHSSGFIDTFDRSGRLTLVSACDLQKRLDSRQVDLSAAPDKLNEGYTQTRN